jgi:hypothetical protein
VTKPELRFLPKQAIDVLDGATTPSPASILPPGHEQLFSRFQPALSYERIAGVLGCDEPFVTEVAASGLHQRPRRSPAPHPGAW